MRKKQGSAKARCGGSTQRLQLTSWGRQDLLHILAGLLFLSNSLSEYILLITTKGFYRITSILVVELLVS
jgi:hypothetical protein